MKKACILLASPRKQGNTAALTAPFAAELEKLGWSCRTVWLYDLEVRPCRACRVCQQDWTVFGCPQEDDMQEIFDSVLACDLLVLATPIYSWYCTAPVKAALDRLVYAMDKYYGPRGKGPALLAGKPMAAVLTCGYRPEKGTDLFAEGMRRWCRHTGMRWLGSLEERHMGYGTVFMDSEKASHARAFAQTLMTQLTDASAAGGPAAR